MRAMSGRRSAALAAIIVGALVIVGRPLERGLSFVVRAAQFGGPIGRLAAIDVEAASERDVVLESATLTRLPRRGRLYVPRNPHSYTLLVSGLHPAGIDEPRLVNFARQLAGSGVGVLTPDIPELSRFEITPGITDAIEASARWLAGVPDVARVSDRIGLIGISFSGGLSLVAAGRPALTNRIRSVVSFGGHDDLQRVLRYLCTGEEPYPPQQVGKPNQPYVRPPHDYGVAVILLNVAPRLVPRAEVDPLQKIVRAYLDASALDNVDKDAGGKAFADVRTAAGKLPEPAATLARYMSERDVVHLGARLLPYIGEFGGDPALSVSRSPKPSAPVFLLHGSDDNVIPPIESEYLANDLRGHAPVRLLLSGLISHASADRPAGLNDVLQLGNFWGDVLTR